MSDLITLRLYETIIPVKKDDFTGATEERIVAISGSRLLVTVYVSEIDVEASVSVEIKNSFDVETAEVLETITRDATGRTKRVFTDFHGTFIITATVTGGNASFKVGLTMFDNALSTSIENASIGVDINHSSDSVRIGDGIDFVSVNSDGSINAKLPELRGATASLTQVSASASTVQLLASNANRKGAIFYNNSNSVAYLAFASTASTSAYTIQMAAKSLYILGDMPIFTGSISAIWDSATGDMKVTEL